VFDATPRTRLHPLPPIGVGTGRVESLTGYIARLAYAHRISMGTLFREVFEPALRESGLFTASVTLNNRLSEEEVQPIDVKPSWVPLIEELTGQHGLSDLTVSGWREVITERRLVRGQAAYCARCFAADLTTDGPYKRLSWRLSAVESCSAHGLSLLIRCWKCGSLRPPLGPWSVPGYCTHCWSWLGRRRADSVPQEVPSKWTTLRTSLVEEALAARTTELSPRGAFRESLKAALSLTGGNQAAVSRMLGLRAKSNVTNWLGRSLAPSLDTTVRLAAATGADLASILAGRPSFDVRPRVQPPMAKGRRALDWPGVGRHLARELRRSEARSLGAVARELEIARQELKKYFPDLSNALIDRHKVVRRRRSEERTSRLVETVERIVRDLQAAAVYPSARAVEAALPNGIDLREAPLRAAWQRATGASRLRRLDGSSTQEDKA
jgi:TniQ